jgi:hypothetical protein
MRPLYQQLKARGIDRHYVPSAVLPDWWDDSLYQEPSNRQLAQLHLARFLGVPVAQLASPATPLTPAGQPARLKRGRNAADSHVAGAVAAAMHAERIVADLMRVVIRLGERGKYARRMRAGAPGAVFIDPDLRDRFPASASVNRALRASLRRKVPARA